MSKFSDFNFAGHKALIRSQSQRLGQTGFSSN
jgi:hypothetical protein